MTANKFKLKMFPLAVWMFRAQRFEPQMLRVGLCPLAAMGLLQDIIQIKKKKYSNSTISLISRVILTQGDTHLCSHI